MVVALLAKPKQNGMQWYGARDEVARSVAEMGALQKNGKKSN